MKKGVIIIVLLWFYSCQQPDLIEKEWLESSIDFNSITEEINTYQMLDSTGSKVGSMVFGMEFKEGRLVARDTSQFDDGSIYETAEFIFDTADFEMRAVSIDMATSHASIDLDITIDKKKVEGTYVLKRDTSSITYPIDSIYNHNLVRSELYMLLQTLNLNAGDTVEMKVLVPSSMSVSASQLYYEGKEEITTPSGTFDCDVVWIKTDGKMPANKVWIKRESPRKLIKFYVPGPELTMELMFSKSL